MARRKGSKNRATLIKELAAAGKSVTMQASFAYLGGTAVTMALADYSGLAGWDSNWAPASANTADWTVAGTGGNATSGFCT